MGRAHRVVAERLPGQPHREPLRHVGPHPQVGLHQQIVIYPYAAVVGHLPVVPLPSVLRTSAAARPATTTSRTETLGMVANYFATQLDAESVDVPGRGSVLGYDTSGDGVVDTLDVSGDGNLDATVSSDGKSITVDGKRACQQSLAAKAVPLAERVTSRADESFDVQAGSTSGTGMPAPSPRVAELEARRAKLNELREKRKASEARRQGRP